MIRDFRDYADGAHLAAELCVIGAGPAGLALAREFIGSGTQVVVVESGGLASEPDLDSLNDADVTGLPHHGSQGGRVRRFGGGGALWDGACVRLGALDCERRDWVPHSGWPIARSELDPCYSRAD